MYFDLSIRIARLPVDVFAFLRDKDLFPQPAGSPVLALDKTTPGPAGVGTGYREVVQMLPLIRGEIRSRVTRFEPPRFLEEDFRGAGMSGHLAYEFVPHGEATLLVQRETLEPYGIARLFAGVIERSLATKLPERLESIRLILESGWQAGHD